jgi:hypothetical protein
VNVPQGEGEHDQATPEFELSFVTVAAMEAVLLISKADGGAVVIATVIGLLEPPQADKKVATVHASAIRRALRFIAAVLPSEY